MCFQGVCELELADSFVGRLPHVDFDVFDRWVEIVAHDVCEERLRNMVANGCLVIAWRVGSFLVALREIESLLGGFAPAVLDWEC